MPFAAKILDYHHENLIDHLENFDVFFDTMAYINEEVVLGKDSAILRRKLDSESPKAFYINILSSPYSTEGLKTFGTDPFGLSIPEARVDKVITINVDFVEMEVVVVVVVV